MLPKVSVIIPIYNVETFLTRCVESVLNQTMKELEIILVNDGSTDNSPRLCDKFKLEDSRIKVIHKKNGGLASARNAGLRVATAEYIFFLDSDDWLELNGLQHLCELADKYQVDFVRYRSIRSGWPGMPEHTPCFLEKAREMDGGLYDRERIRKEIYPRLLVTPELTFGPILGAWGALYRHSFLKRYSLEFYEDIKFSEDVLFSANVVRKADKFYYDDAAGVYHYYYNANSISKSFRAGRWDSCKRLIERAYEDFSEDRTYDFTVQLHVLSWFCILLALNERWNLTSRKERQRYCKRIMNDEVVRTCAFHRKWFSVGLKQKWLMWLIKCNIWWLVAEV